ncbi:family 78 glycoside hydrolase catalytic domain [Aquirufa sp. OSTEICH-129V]|uniref:alpha-L-rhamnosidase n=1 Tax=Aquirufa avitistagni TaxID=3104728 RepID=A0ABW6DAE6_9BACT
MKILLQKCLVLAFFLSPLWLFAQISVQSIQIENQQAPQGVGVLQPRFSWQLSSPNRNVTQKSYSIHVLAGRKTVWKSGKIDSDQSLFIPYAGDELKSNQAYQVAVQVWDNQGKASKVLWSEFRTSLLRTADWKAKWISSGIASDSVDGRVPILAKSFFAKKEVKSARLFITARGLYDASINGKRVGDAYLSPGWTSYNKHLQFQVYDISAEVKKGLNQLDVLMGSGWFRTRIAWENNKNFYGAQTALLSQLEITYADGSTESVLSDNSWKASLSHILTSEIYDGEKQDTRIRPTTWSAVVETTASMGVLHAQINEPMRKQEQLKVAKVLRTKSGKTILDFGQNVVGWVKLTVKGKAGQAVKLYHVEMLDKTGEPYFANLRSAKAQAEYILNGEQQVLEPHFTFFGFRYVQVEGIDVQASDYQAIALNSDMKPSGTFETSNPLLNQLQSNIRWGQKGNFLDVPTDCPQRDERLGWTGDAEVFSRTAAFNFNVNQFFAKWLKDVAADQAPNGAVPFVIPDVLTRTTIGKDNNQAGAAGWSDASIIIPYNIYTTYGDKQVLENQYSSMKAYLNYVRGAAKNDLWNTGFQFADWLSYRVDDSKGMIGQKSAVTDNYLVAQCFYAYNTQLMIKTARILGKMDDFKEWERLLERIKLQFQKEFMTANGRLISETQTAYILALQFDMIPASLREAALGRLVANIESYKYHLTTGFLGTPFLNPVLTRFGRNDVAYKLLLQDTYPSWLYPIKAHGATTIWERWDSMKPDSTFQDPGMTSFNHYAYGAIGDWMYRTVGGIDTEEFDGAGYKQIVIKPELGGGLSFAKTSLETPYGKVSSDWRLDSGEFTLTVEVPVNTSATVELPRVGADQMTQDGEMIPGNRIRIGSGKYVFTVK